jgi:hypothetical protein
LKNRVRRRMGKGPKKKSELWISAGASYSKGKYHVESHIK